MTPDLYHVEAICRDFPVAAEQIAAIEKVAVQKHATVYKRKIKGTQYGVVLFLCETRERGEKLTADLLAHAPIVTARMHPHSARYDSTPFLYPVGSRVRAREDIYPDHGDPDTLPLVKAGSQGTVKSHEDANSYKVNFDGVKRTVFCYDFELADPEHPTCCWNNCGKQAHYHVNNKDVGGYCCCDHLADVKNDLEKYGSRVEVQDLDLSHP